MSNIGNVELFLSPTRPIEISGYQIRDTNDNTIYFSRGFGKDTGIAAPIPGMNPALGIKYVFPQKFLNSKSIASQLQFTNITDLPLSNLELIEVHYLQGKQLQRFHFDLCFAPPKT